MKPQLYKLSDTGKIKGAKEAEIEEWEKMLVIDDRNEHVVDTVKGLRPAIGWNKYWLP